MAHNSHWEPEKGMVSGICFSQWAPMVAYVFSNIWAEELKVYFLFRLQLHNLIQDYTCSVLVTDTSVLLKG